MNKELRGIRKRFEILSSEYGGGGMELDDALEAFESALSRLADAVANAEEAYREALDRDL